ncbi:MAG: hypothetical protein KDI55_19170 [Anaerolineae bacterium]|nr:hypothetical protein [Anaerolineae bacterium]MCB0255844.1 hypothetical protein [Anaerolineae bacterium]
MKIGEVLAERYQITEVDWREWVVPGIGDAHKVFIAHDLRTNTEYGVLPLGKIPHLDKILQSIVDLRHSSLPKMDIISHIYQDLFVCEMVAGTQLPHAAIRGATELTSIGVQLCSLLQTTGLTGRGFSWRGLAPWHVLIGEDNHVWINVWRYCNVRISDSLMGPAKGATPLNPFSIAFSVASQSDQHNGLELAEISIVGQAMLIGATGDVRASTHQGPMLGELFKRILDITPSLATIVVGTANFCNIRLPWIHSLESLANCLNSPPSPVRAKISDSHVDFGTIDRGETQSRQIRLASVTEGLLISEITDVTNGLIMGDTSFSGLHPCCWDIEVTWDATQLGDIGLTQKKFSVVTPLEIFQVIVQADVRS